VKLNLGCADRYAEGWHNVDHEACPHRRDETVDLTGPLPWPDHSITHVYAGHVLEHLTRDQCLKLLTDLRDRMVPGGQIMVVGPDIELAQRMGAGPWHTMDELLHGGMVTLTTIWGAAPTIEAAFLAGPLGGLAAALVQFAVTTAISDTWHGRTLYSGVLLVVTGVVVGYVARLAVRAEAELRNVAGAQAALAERERLAREIHDGVLQVLGLVGRGGDDPVASEARRQEAALRALITSSPGEDASSLDLADALRALRTDSVTVSAPDRLVLPRPLATALRDAVRAALHNVERHAGAGARAWVFAEEDATDLRVTVRDDGAGFATGRLDDAQRDGRFGVAHSIRGRVADVGGTTTITSAPGEGTTIEMTVPWPPA